MAMLSANLSCLLAADPYSGASPSPMSLPAALCRSLHLVEAPQKDHDISEPKGTSCLTDQRCGWDLGDQGWRNQHLAMDACGSGWLWIWVGKLGEVPNTLCSYQRSMDVTGMATHRDLAL